MKSLADRLAEFFRSRPGQWIDGRQLAHVAGSYAWRTRVSDLRRAPYFMTITNRQRRVRVGDKTFIISEYSCARSQSLVSSVYNNISADKSVIRGRALESNPARALVSDEAKPIPLQKGA